MISWLWWAQLAVDVLLLAAVLALFFKNRAPGRGGRGSAPADLEGFLAEAGRLSREFDRLLAEKRELVNGTLATLDARIAQLRRMAAGLEPPAQAPAGAKAASPPAGRGPAKKPEPVPASFRERVLDLHRQGQSAQQIAKALGRPRGEVELALSLGK